MTDIRQSFHQDHVRLEAIFDELVNAVDSNDSPTIQRTWDLFEEGLAAHLEAEEQQMLPVLEQGHPEEIAHIRVEHEKIRDLVCQLGIDADLHLLRKDVAERLVAFLREHAKREDETLYKWADSELEPGIVDKLKLLLGKAIHRGDVGQQVKPASNNRSA